MKEDEARALFEQYMMDDTQQRALQRCAQVLVKLSLPLTTLEIPATDFESKQNDGEVTVEDIRIGRAGQVPSNFQLNNPWLRGQESSLIV